MTKPWTLVELREELALTVQAKHPGLASPIASFSMQVLATLLDYGERLEVVENNLGIGAFNGDYTALDNKRVAARGSTHEEAKTRAMARGVRAPAVFYAPRTARAFEPGDRLEPGDRVLTVKADLDPSYLYTPGAREGNRYGVWGRVVEVSPGHGICYQVRHDGGGAGWYERAELLHADLVRDAHTELEAALRRAEERCLEHMHGHNGEISKCSLCGAERVLGLPQGKTEPHRPECPFAVLNPASELVHLTHKHRPVCGGEVPVNGATVDVSVIAGSLLRGGSGLRRPVTCTACLERVDELFTSGDIALRGALPRRL